MKAFARQTLLVAGREIRLLLGTPMYWVLTGVFFLASAFVFTTLLLGYSDPGLREQHKISADVTLAVIRDLFYVLHYFLMIQIPLLTMRAVAEEKRHNTLALLQTTAVGEWSIVAGKYLANAGAMLLYLAITLVFPLIVQILGGHTGVATATPDWPVVASCYAALVLATSAYVALGIFFSCMTESQVVSAVLTYVALFILLVFSGVSDSLQAVSLVELARHLTLQAHIDGFLSGSIALVDVAYFVVFSFVFLFFGVRQLESLRWRT